MPIKIVDVPDPFTPASSSTYERPPFIESDAYRQLVHELARYCSGEVAGRSFLIAGHRGAGKTTLVSSAFEALFRKWSAARDPFRAASSRPGPMLLRPLPVLLQGPTLLPGSEKDLPLNMDGTGEAGRRLTEMENVLVQITLGLHRAVAREMVTAFRAHVTRFARSTQLNQQDLLELAAQLQLELDDYTGKARLRDLWRRCGAVRFGVLYATGAGPDPLMLHDEIQPPRPTFALPGRDQGLRELIGLASVCDAYRRISGKISRKNEEKAEESGKTERTTEADFKGKEFAGPLIAALAGAAVGTGTAAVGGNVKIAALAGVLTALAGVVAGKVTVSRKRERSTSLEDLFIPDLSVATMDRILPVLLERVRDAGLAPIFVVDELDKVEGLSTRILEMIRRLKKMVAENACFCFLADRSYFEEMQQRTARAAYSIEHTYFTHQLFVSFRHPDVRRYLEQVLARPADGDGKDPKAATEIKEEQADHAVLPYILMHNAQMHPIDLLRQLAQLRNAEGNVILGPGLVRSKPRYQLELLVQLAVELQLEQDSMQEELDRRPAFRRLAHDAMFYISRQWERDEPALSLGDDTFPAFERYLIGRMAVEKAPGAPPAGDDADKPPLITAEDLKFLWERVQALGRSLADPDTIRAEYEKRGTTEVVVSALREAVKLGSLLERVPGAADSYRWRFHRSGRRVLPSPAAPAAAADVRQAPAVIIPILTWRDDVKSVREFQTALNHATAATIDLSTLSAGLGILPTSPAWPQVDAALKRLESVSNAKPTYPEKVDDEAVLKAYVDVLRKNARTVVLSIYAARMLSAWSTSAAEARLRDALEKMAYVLGLDERTPTQVHDLVTSLLGEVERRVKLKLAIDPFPGAGAPVAEWSQWLRALPGPEPVELRATSDLSDEDLRLAWEYWRLRFGLGGMPPNAMLPVLIQALSGTGAFAILKPPLETITLRQWSLAFYEAVRREKDAPPPWVAIVALRFLGWQARMRGFLQLWSDGILVAPRPPLVDPDIEKWALTDHRPRRAHLLIASQPDSVTESWRPEPAIAALVLRWTEWSTLSMIWSPQRAAVLSAFGADFIALDASATRMQAPGRKRRLAGDHVASIEIPIQFLNWFGQTERVRANPIPMIVDDQAPPNVPPEFRIVRSPKSLEEVIQQVTTAPRGL